MDSKSLRLPRRFPSIQFPWRKQAMHRESYCSSHAALQADRDQLLRLDGELHRELLQHVLDEAVDHQGGRLLGRQAALPAVEQHPSEIFEVVASCSNTVEEFWVSIYGTVWAPHLSPIRSESQLVKLRAPLALRCAHTRPR